MGADSCFASAGQATDPAAVGLGQRSSVLDLSLSGQGPLTGRNATVFLAFTLSPREPRLGRCFRRFAHWCRCVERLQCLLHFQLRQVKQGSNRIRSTGGARIMAYVAYIRTR